MAQFKDEQERLNRANYNSAMLHMMAQPTRKSPEDLPRYKPLFSENRVEKPRKEMTGDEILQALIGNG